MKPQDVSVIFEDEERAIFTNKIQAKNTSHDLTNNAMLSECNFLSIDVLLLTVKKYGNSFALKLSW